MMVIIIFYLVEKIDGLVIDPTNLDNVTIDYDQFMQIMTRNIIKNREKFGKENILFESGIIFI
jgi:hypothetical protein